ncbi:hypothetical protein [Ferruginibacter sp.]|uniref:HYC_CC_PP family protein n=1 Tax=Ferruginibacter sp. TaxID=1940288 RepID=UPI00265B34AC|nr:hypothetical protein [Ferruginibacter sp.]
MKKIVVAILALLYISTSVGATVHVHYCMGKLAGWELGFAETKTCNKCGMQKSSQKQNGCCNDESHLIQNNTDQRIAEPAFNFTQSVPVAMPVSFFELRAPVIFSVTTANPGVHSPPPVSTVAVYVRNCVFLI